MSTKSIFGMLLTLVGLVGIIYGGIDLTKGEVARASIVYLVLGGVFFAAGIGLLKATRE